MHDGFREDVRDPDHHGDRSCASPSLERIQELLAEREDLLCIAKRHATCVGQHQAPPLAREQLRPQDCLQSMDLAADRRVGQAEHSAGPSDAALLRNHPEVEQMVVVEPFHAGSIRRLGRTSTRYFLE